jgi:hypothetical protein
LTEPPFSAPLPPPPCHRSCPPPAQCAQPACHGILCRSRAPVQRDAPAPRRHRTDFGDRGVRTPLRRRAPPRDWAAPPAAPAPSRSRDAAQLGQMPRLNAELRIGGDMRSGGICGGLSRLQTKAGPTPPPGGPRTSDIGLRPAALRPAESTQGCSTRSLSISHLCVPPPISGSSPIPPRGRAPLPAAVEAEWHAQRQTNRHDRLPGEVLGTQDDDVAELGLWLPPTLQYTLRRSTPCLQYKQRYPGKTLLSSATSYGAGGTLRRDRLCLWSKGLPVAETE